MQNQPICCEKSKYAFDENSYGHFCPGRKAANFCHPDVATFLFFKSYRFCNNFLTPMLRNKTGLLVWEGIPKMKSLIGVFSRGSRAPSSPPAATPASTELSGLSTSHPILKFATSFFLKQARTLQDTQDENLTSLQSEMFGS